MNRRPPRSPPFPYTPLFGSVEVARRVAERVLGLVDRPPVAGEDGTREPVRRRLVHEPERLLPLPLRVDVRRHDRARSEEHTSELQSRQYLVCRLLLEKKKIS